MRDGDEGEGVGGGEGGAYVNYTEDNGGDACPNFFSFRFNLFNVNTKSQATINLCRKKKR